MRSLKHYCHTLPPLKGEVPSVCEAEGFPVLSYAPRIVCLSPLKCVSGNSGLCPPSGCRLSLPGNCRLCPPAKFSFPIVIFTYLCYNHFIVTIKESTMQNFHIAESSIHCALNLTLAEMFNINRSLIRDDIRIASFFGSPNLIWNGGRMMLAHYNPSRSKALIKAYNDMGIPYRFTFTNPAITEKDLDDYDCNDMLDFADNGLNECIVYSPILEEHIRKTHPGMKLTSSTCKCITDINEVKEELARPYSLVVLDFNFNNNFDALEKLTPEERKRCELLCNAVCQPGCKRRAEHYRFIGEQQLHYREYLERINRLPPAEREKQKLEEWECPYRQIDLFHKEYPLWITQELIHEKYVPMGFENFKLEGRGSNMMSLAEQISRWFAADGCTDELRYELMFHTTNNIGLNF